MLVQFEKVACLKHKLPFQYICSNYNCKCSVRLCLRCAQEHQNKADIEDDFIKETVYSKKLEIQTQIIARQYSYLQSYKDTPTQTGLLNSKNQESIQLVELILLALNEDKKNIFTNLEQFNFNHYEVKKKLNKVKNISYTAYLSNIRNKQLASLLVNLSSESGLERLRKKVVAAHNCNQRYNDFINAVQKYGSNSNQFMCGLGFKEQNLFKIKLNYCLSKWRSNKKVEVNDQRVRQKQNTQRKREESEKRVRGIQLRNNSPARKISLVSANRRPKTSANKQN